MPNHAESPRRTIIEHLDFISISHIFVYDTIPSPFEPLYAVLAFFFLFFNLTYSRWTSSLPSCLWSLRIFPSLPGSRVTMFYRDASSALLQLVNQWLTYVMNPPPPPSPSEKYLRGALRGAAAYCIVLSTRWCLEIFGGRLRYNIGISRTRSAGATDHRTLHCKYYSIYFVPPYVIDRKHMN